jgi:hypothetical protein
MINWSDNLVSNSLLLLRSEYNLSRPPTRGTSCSSYLGFLDEAMCFRQIGRVQGEAENRSVNYGKLQKEWDR